MTSYVIFQEDVLDPEAFETYKQLSPQSIAKYGGEFVVRGGAIDVLEGDFWYQRVVVIAFPSAAQAQAWHRSDDYAEAKALRLKISTGSAILVEGVA